MKKTLGLIVFALIVTAIFTALADIPIDEINFPDPAFREYVKQFDKDGNERFSEEEINDVETIKGLYDRGIYSLAGIGCFSALKELNCAAIDLEQLDVSQNLMLEKLYCRYNLLTSLDVSKNSKLHMLYCDENKIDQLDVSQNPELESLSCRNNQLTKLNLGQNNRLKKLYCDHNQLHYLEIRNNTALEDLSCDQNNLDHLDIRNNDILVRYVEEQEIIYGYDEENIGWYILGEPDEGGLTLIEAGLCVDETVHLIVSDEKILLNGEAYDPTETTESQNVPEIVAVESYGEKRWDADGVFLVPEKIIVPPSFQAAQACFMNNGRIQLTPPEQTGFMLNYPLYESYPTDTKVQVSYHSDPIGSEVYYVKIDHTEFDSNRYETEHYYFYSWDIVYQQTDENVFEFDHIEITPQGKQGEGWTKIQLSASLEILKMEHKDYRGHYYDYISEIEDYDWSRLNLAVGDTLDLYPEESAWEHSALFDELFSRAAGRYTRESEWYNRKTQKSDTIDGLSYYVREDGTAVIDRYWVDEKQDTITIPEEADGYPVVGIGDSVYGKNVTRVIIPGCVVDIADNPFDGMEKLKEIIISPDNSNLENIDGVVYSKSDKRLVCASTAKIGDFVVPDGIEVIGDGAFWCNPYIREITIPGSVRIIGNSAFYGCKNLSSVHLSEGLQIIGSSAFHTVEKYGEISKLSSIELPEGLLYIGSSAFDLTRITSMVIPDSVEIIERGCFPDTLREVKLPANLMYITQSLFYGTQVQEVVIPEQVKMIEDDAFVNCKNLRKVVFPEGLRFIGSDIFGGCYQLTEVNIPASVDFIHESAFTDGNSHFLDHNSYTPAPVSKKLMITVVQDTYGEDFCKRMEINCKYPGEN